MPLFQGVLPLLASDILRLVSSDRFFFDSDIFFLVSIDQESPLFQAVWLPPKPPQT